ncbi:TonB-dependent siderophore receptor [Salinisphaera aquimarina]|uniref:TonB-dependent siderophore receptor n=1 Tax=Salinisphaera aquimarina TaxID=2094031 RepID=A0ABV7ETP4_9GAMM
MYMGIEASTLPGVDAKRRAMNARALILGAVVVGGLGHYGVSLAQSNGSQSQLAPLVVSGSEIGNADAPTEGYTVDSSRGATKTDTPLIETPQTINVITREQLDNQASTNINDALRYTPGVFTGLAGASKRSDTVALRGFHGGDVNNTFLDGLRLQTDPGSYSAVQIDPYFLERIDVVKGPSSVLYGRAIPGGLVALTSKKPQFEDKRQVRIYGGSHDQIGGGLDVTGPIGDSDTAAYRVVAVGRHSDTQFDVAERENYGIMPSASFKLSDDTDLLLQAYFTKTPEGDYHGAVPAGISINDSQNGRKVGPSFYDGDPDREKFERAQRLFSYQLEHRVNDNVTLRQNASYLDMDVELEQVYQIGFAGPGSSTLNRYYSGSDEDLKAFSIDNQAQFDFDTGVIGHQLLVGFDYQNRQNRVRFDSAPATSIDAFDPVYDGDPLTGPIFSSPANRKLDQMGVYLQDQLSLANWRLTLSGRQDWLDADNLDLTNNTTSSVNADSFSGRAGLLYKSDIGLSPYVSYSEGFSPSSYTDENGQLLEPMTSHQYEAGIKYQHPGTENIVSLAVYELTQENVASRTTVQSAVYEPVGEVRSRGVELDARAALTDRLSVLAGYAYTDIEYTNSTPDREGNSPTLAPEHMASLWGQYDIGHGIDAGAGVRYMGKSWTSDLNETRVPDYTLADAFVSFDLGHYSKPLDGATLRINANNIFDKEYVSGCFNDTYCYWGDVRNVTATLDYNF